MVPRSLQGIDSANVLPRRSRSGRLFYPAPMEKPKKVGTMSIPTAQNSLPVMDGVYTGSIKCDVYKSIKFTADHSGGLRLLPDDQISFPCELSQQIHWNQEVFLFSSFKH